MTLEPKNYLSISHLSEFINENFISKSNSLSPAFLQKRIIEIRMDVKQALQSLRYFFPDIETPSEAIYILNNGEHKGCMHCGNNTTFISYTQGYRKFCNTRCSMLHNPNVRASWSFEQKKALFDRISQTMKGKPLSDEHRKKLKIAANKNEVKKKKRDTCLERYGLENPGVLGAFSSKAALEYIEEFIKNNNIPKELCMYKNNDKREFYQNITESWMEKYRFTSYDLVVFDDIESKNNKNVCKIKMVLEYNGPWHYLPDEIIGQENILATPYPNSLTKSQTVEIDKLKMSKILENSQHCQYYVYWEKTKSLIIHKYDDMIA